MKITGIELIPIEIPLSRDFGGSRYNVTSRCTVITRMQTDEGLVSEVYNGDNRTHIRDIVKIIEDELAPIVIGEEVHAVERIWAKMFRLAEWNRDRKLVMEAIACVDTALWDLMGKAAGVNVCRLLGGFRQEMPIISIGGYYEQDKTLADLGREMEQLREWGMAGCKVKVGGLSAEKDAERVAAAREGGGPDFMLAVDANRGWPLAEAQRFARLIEKYDIAWFEEPCHWYDDARLMAGVRRVTSIPINAGQSESTAAGVRRLVEAGAVDIVNFDASEAGGITEWRRAAALCQLHDIGLAHHEEPQIALQMLAAYPNGIAVECFANIERDPLWPGLVANKPQPKDGMIAVPQGPGFGLELDAAMIERYRVD
ncbi:mandelate racemase/muconate lactonizing enzyme family protein [Aurantimonas endophytica]|uniref:L-alanine-DL-glutamate epimerase-like enolase superfamily enzyme n=1 Tax=Aurantimonas endophytica TaxID=1522175 RepID=A0A7W6HES5_9HYPH|nr:mandelate racemase/muconate lactonizing enzyme family protein [Aurantimonas endophytica]MBB4003863.1 L-alanine-DL-glutamate epimerase-like enolase superfamily enzyme [Aurantimonas endophytica]MCO6404713.1 mandelate racemase/muconate lactonizing enzyme family protein [Aurantimonas endophytica]